MRKPAGVIVAAIVLGLMALMGIFGCLISVLVSFFVPNPAMTTVPGMRAFMAVITGFTLCFFLFCAWTVVGLFRMRPWARWSILAIGALDFCLMALLCVVMIAVRNTPVPVTPGTPPSPIGFRAMFLGIAVVYGFMALIGLWWLVYFNLHSVRALFASGSSTAVAAPVPGELGMIVPSVTPGTPGWRIVIIVWACLMLTGVVSLPMFLFMHLPLFMLGTIIRGAAATAVMFGLVAVQVYTGMGLLKKWKAAWYVALAWQVYTVAYMATLMLPSVWSRFIAYQNEMMGRWGFAAHAGDVVFAVNPTPFMRMGMVLGVAIVALFTIALLQRREDYLHA